MRVRASSNAIMVGMRRARYVISRCTSHASVAYTRGLERARHCRPTSQATGSSSSSSSRTHVWARLAADGLVAAGAAPADVAVAEAAVARAVAAAVVELADAEQQAGIHAHGGRVWAIVPACRNIAMW